LLLGEMETWRHSPLLYADACIDGIYYLLVKGEGADLSTHLVQRLSMIGQVFKHARANLDEPLALHCEVASSKIRSFIPLLESFATADGIDTTVVNESIINHAKFALANFASYLDSLAQTANPDFAVGYEFLTKLLETQHLIKEKPQEIVEYAENVLDDALKKRTEIQHETVVEIDTLAALQISRQDVLDHYYAEIDSARSFLKATSLVTEIPDVRVVVTETPIFLQELIPGFAYEPPGPFDSEPVGYLYIPPIEENLSLAEKLRYWRLMKEHRLRGVIVHEIYPGHHLQLTYANRCESLIRKLQEDTFTIEGWALYCEGLMAEHGFYGPEGMQRALGGLIFRAARAIVDVKLQTGEFDIPAAVDFMARVTGASRQFLEKEVRRYAVEPTQPMSYLIGRRVILSLRDQYRRSRGESFDIAQFHRILLSCGSLPPELLRICFIEKMRQ